MLQLTAPTNVVVVLQVSPTLAIVKHNKGKHFGIGTPLLVSSFAYQRYPDPRLGSKHCDNKKQKKMVPQALDVSFNK